MAISFVSSTGPTAGTTTISTLNFPATKQIGDLFFLWITYVGAASNTATISGWGSKVLTVSGGSVFMDLYTRRVATGVESGSVGTITATGATDMLASVATYRSGTGELVLGSAVSGSDAVSDVTYSAVTGSMSTVSNGALVYACGWTPTMGAVSARAITQTGATFGTLTARFAAASTASRQEVGDRPVTTGATGAITFAATLPVAGTGITGIAGVTELAGGINKTDGHTLQYHMNRKAGTLVGGVPTVEAQGAANIWAGTTGMDLVGALNVRAGNTSGGYRELAGVLNQLAGTTGLEIDGAAASIP